MERALREAGIDLEVTATRELGGGCIHRVLELTLADGSRLVAKMNDGDRLVVFREEAAGLRALAATGTVLVPTPLAVTEQGGTAMLLLTALEPGPATDAAWRRFGGELAALHAGSRREPPLYGFDGDNYLGATPQPNGWCDDWVEFNAERRLGHQLSLAGRGGLLDAREADCIGRVIDRLPDLIPRHPGPSLLHGDLWSGNALAARDGEGAGRIAVIDPACSFGDGWADVAMMKLFGGFPQCCFDAYAAAAAAEDRDQLETRIAVYQLYHVLNHVNLFGRGYVGQAMALARAVGA